eukprot:3508922-Prymnesium_polylepis.2
MAKRFAPFIKESAAKKSAFCISAIENAPPVFFAARQPSSNSLASPQRGRHDEHTLAARRRELPGGRAAAVSDSLCIVGLHGALWHQAFRGPSEGPELHHVR